ncbi:MAG: hypothetical protein GEV03_10850 [Streptosporangiales bacterium]|nr:hypothetical protein [Streptosporangiales bacterium]
MGAARHVRPDRSCQTSTLLPSSRLVPCQLAEAGGEVRTGVGDEEANAGIGQTLEDPFFQKVLLLVQEALEGCFAFSSSPSGLDEGVEGIQRLWISVEDVR